MDVFKEFMRTSSIHGFSHIITTQRFSRIFWILVVILSISSSALLILQSLRTWSKSPISTTIETLPISRIHFPKVIVCPPKSTQTNLNQDLVMSENLTLDKTTKDELVEYIKETILGEQSK